MVPASPFIMQIVCYNSKPGVKQEANAVNGVLMDRWFIAYICRKCPCSWKGSWGISTSQGSFEESPDMLVVFQEF